MSESQNSNTSTNLMYQDFNALQLRLDTQKLHRDIYNFLKGTTTVVQFDKATGQYAETELIQGQPLANDKGIQNILNLIVSVFNSHTVQGNTKNDDFREILYFMEIHLAQQLTYNALIWGIDKKNRRHIKNTIMLMAQLFLSRTIDNLEREGLKPLVQKDTTVVRETEKKGLI